jgi:hypothetical protein
MDELKYIIWKQRFENLKSILKIMKKVIYEQRSA